MRLNVQGVAGVVVVLSVFAFRCPLVLAQTAVTKQVCLASFGMDWRTSEEAKRLPKN